jgi:L-rhamnose mutarotase
MQRVCFLLQVKPDRLAEYTGRHAAVWPDMLAALARHGWQNYSLFLKDDGVCSLSDILETGDVPQRYYLSAKACQGILRRAGNRGKELPSALKMGLEMVAGQLWSRQP